MNELNSNYKYFFKYLRTENSVNFSQLKKLFTQQEISYYNKNDSSISLGWITFQQIMRHKKLFFCRYDKLNDPFECIVNIDYTQKIPDEIIEKYYEIIPSNILISRGFNNLEALKQSIAYYTQEKRMPPYSPSPPMPVGIYSLNTEPTNIQMWSHYANNHQGICIVFSINWEFILSQIKLKKPAVNSERITSILLNEGFRFSITNLDGDTIRFGLQKVEYINSVMSYPAAKFMKAHFNKQEEEELAWALARAKHINWQYENEWRLVCFNQYSDDSDQLMPLTELFNFITPCGIILGINMSPKIKELVNH